MSEQAADLTAEIALTEAEQGAILYCDCEHPWSFHLSTGCTYDLDAELAAGKWVTPTCGCVRPDETLTAVERIIAARVAALGGERARLAAVEALADEFAAEKRRAAKWASETSFSFAEAMSRQVAWESAENRLRAALDAPAGDA